MKTSSLKIRDAKKELIIGKKTHILMLYKYDRSRFRKKHYHGEKVELRPVWLKSTDLEG